LESSLVGAARGVGKGIASGCSTPFGIIGIFTYGNRVEVDYGDRCSTPFGIIGIFTSPQFPTPHLRPPVLNAFRHHWNLHVFREGQGNEQTGVLNAFRHHWNLHPRGISTVDQLRACSTPFGIIGIFTQICSQDPFHPHAVLNAFRHHWNLHEAPPA